MSRKGAVTGVLRTLIAVPFVLTACIPIAGSRVAGLQTETQTVELGDAKRVDVEIQMGAGPANLALGDLALTGLNIDGGAGTVTIDLTGDWQSDLDATIAGGFGPLNLILPGDVGVSVEVEPGVGGVDASGLRREGNSYTNDAFGQSDVRRCPARAY